jgi:hypothetical protein
MRRIRLYSRLLLSDFKDKIYRRKTRPPLQILQTQAESLYDENLDLKSRVNILQQHLTMQKTQNKLLNQELEKQHDIVKRVVLNEGGKNQEAVLLLSLKRELDKALKLIADKDQEIDKLKKSIKITRVIEIDVSIKYNRFLIIRKKGKLTCRNAQD